MEKRDTRVKLATHYGKIAIKKNDWALYHLLWRDFQELCLKAKSNMQKS